MSTSVVGLASVRHDAGRSTFSGLTPGLGRGLRCTAIPGRAPEAGLRLAAMLGLDPHPVAFPPLIIAAAAADCCRAWPCILKGGAGRYTAGRLVGGMGARVGNSTGNRVPVSASPRSALSRTRSNTCGTWIQCLAHRRGNGVPLIGGKRGG